MEGKKSFLLYCDQKGLFDQLPDKDAGKLIKLIFAYVNDENPDIDDLLLKVAFEPIKLQLKRDLVTWNNIVERNRINGSKGGRPSNNPKEPKKPTGLFGKPRKPKKPDNDIDIDIYSNKDNIDNIDTISNNKGNQLFIKAYPSKHLFCEAMSTRAEGRYSEYDLEHYYDKVLNWSDSKKVMRKDWLAQAGNFILGDEQRGQAVKPKTTNQVSN